MRGSSGNAYDSSKIEFSNHFHFQFVFCSFFFKRNVFTLNMYSSQHGNSGRRLKKAFQGVTDQAHIAQIIVIQWCLLITFETTLFCDNVTLNAGL